MFRKYLQKLGIPIVRDCGTLVHPRYFFVEKDIYMDIRILFLTQVS